MEFDIRNLSEMGFSYKPLAIHKPVSVDPTNFYTLDHIYPLVKEFIPRIVSFPFKVKTLKNILEYIRDNEFVIIHSSEHNTAGGIFARRIMFRGNTDPFMDVMICINSSVNDDTPQTDLEGWESSSITICYSTAQTARNPEIFKFLDTLAKFKVLKSDAASDKGKVLIFEKNEYNELCLNPYKIKEFKLSLDDNYNDDFPQVHDNIQKWITDFSIKNNKLVLFNGSPGTGKTNYLRYLLNSTPDIKKIYIPPYTVEAMADPSFLPILRREKDSLIIIEDAEKILQSRDNQESASVVSILLNLCDGIMADILNFKVIATFNTDESNIDPALMRRGRMFAHYKFDKLSPTKTKKLFESVHGVEFDENKSLSLAEIYNPENEFSKKVEKKRIGFI